MARFFLPPPPRRGVYHWRHRIVLDGSAFFLEYHYNSRTDRYSLHVDDASAQPLARHIAITVRSDLLAPYRFRAVPPGVLSVVDSTGRGEDPKKDELFDRVVLAYDEVGG